MEKEDKTLVKSLLFTASFVFAILAVCVLINITIDFNEMLKSSDVLTGANLTPLLVMFYLITFIVIATIVISYIFTFVDGEKSDIWKNRLIVCNIILITLTVTIYAIMQFSAYISLGEIKKAVETNSVGGFARKYYTSKMSNVMMLITISLLINMFILKVKTALLSAQANQHQDDATVADNSEEAILARQIADIKSKIRIQNLQEEKARLEGELDSNAQVLEGEQISIDSLATSSGANETHLSDSPVEQNELNQQNIDTTPSNELSINNLDKKD